jgi:hypothetical protein
VRAEPARRCYCGYTVYDTNGTFITCGGHRTNFDFLEMKFPLRKVSQTSSETKYTRIRVNGGPFFVGVLIDVVSCMDRDSACVFRFRSEKRVRKLRKLENSHEREREYYVIPKFAKSKSKLLNLNLNY